MIHLPMPTTAPHSPLLIVASYLLCLALVPLYVAMYPVWQLIGNILADELVALLPIAATLSILCGLLIGLPRKNTVTPPNKKLILYGAALCCAGLALPDPGIPVKRIHVAEYLALALAVRHAMSFRLQGVPLLVFSGLFCCLLGIHDEFLQGLHPSRTFGLRDMLVNASGSFGGSLIFHGFGLFIRNEGGPGEINRQSAIPGLLYLTWLLVAIVALIVPVAVYPDVVLPFWPAIPLLGCAAVYLLYQREFLDPWKHGVAALSAAALALTVYPLLSRIERVSFY